MRPDLRQCFGVEILDAMHDVRVWGYPREIAIAEMLAGVWFRYGPGVFWLVVDGECGEGEIGLHVALPEAARGTVDRAEFLRTACVIAELAGYATLAVELIGETAKMDALAKRYGWTRRGSRWYLSVRG